MKAFALKQLGIPCDEANAPAALEMERYFDAHPGGPAAVRRPRLFIRGGNFVVLPGRSVGEGIAGFGATVPSALRAFEHQYLNEFRPPRAAEGRP